MGSSCSLRGICTPPYVQMPPYIQTSPICLMPHTSVCPHAPLYICVSRGYLHMIWGWGHICTICLGFGRASAQLSGILVSVR